MMKQQLGISNQQLGKKLVPSSYFLICCSERKDFV